MDVYGFPLYSGECGPKGFSNPFESEVQSIIQLGEISDDRTIYALNNLTRELKNSGLWDKMSHIYPIVGSSKNSMSLNLKNPGSSSITYGNLSRVSKNGIVTLAASNAGISAGFLFEELDEYNHSVGFLLNGGLLNQFANVFMNFSSVSGPVIAAGTTGGIYLNCNFASTSNPITTIWNLSHTFSLAGPSGLMRSKFNNPLDSFISISRRSNTEIDIFENGKLHYRYISPSPDSTSFLPRNILFSVSASNSLNSIYSFIYASKYLNESEMKQFYNIVKKFQNNLDRFKPQSNVSDSLFP